MTDFIGEYAQARRTCPKCESDNIDLNYENSSLYCHDCNTGVQGTKFYIFSSSLNESEVKEKKMVHIEKSGIGKGQYLSASYVEENGIVELKIAGVADVVEKTYHEADGKETTKEQVEVGVKVQDKEGTVQEMFWTMNKTSQNSIIDCLGAESMFWNEKIIPIVVNSSKGNKLAVYVDPIRLKNNYPEEVSKKQQVKLG